MNTKFTTYALYFIKGEIRHYLRDKASLIKTPREIQELLLKLNTARKNIESSYLTMRLRADIYENDEGEKFISFSKFIPKKNVLVAKNQDDYIMAKTTTYKSNKKGSLLKFALEQIIKLGNNAPNNKMYKHVVIEK